MGTLKLKLTKSEKIAALLNQWDPSGKYNKTGDWRAYNFEAETIAQKVRSNSKAASVEKAIRETIGTDLDEREVQMMAQYILAAVKK